MFYRGLYLTLFVGGVIVSWGCDLVEGNVGNPITAIQILKNSSFESFGTPSFDSWSVYPQGSLLASVEPGAPVGGGKYSVALRDSYSARPTVLQLTPALYGTHIYRLSFWFKGSFSNDGGLGWDIKHGDKDQYILQTRLQAEGWAFYSFIDTITCAQNDSIRVGIWPEIYDDEEGVVSFDLLKVEVIE